MSPAKIDPSNSVCVRPHGLPQNRPSQNSPAIAPVLHLRNVAKNFDATSVIADVSLSVQPGEIFTLLGPSGCGKTTTLRIAMGLERSEAGHVTLGGKVVDSPDQRIFVPPERRDVGMVFQSYAIWPHLNVFENVAYPLRARKCDKLTINEKVGRALDLVGLSDFASRSSTKLSGGQQQRVAIARALVFEPKMILMDEPFSNLDASLRSQMRREVKLLQRRLGISILFVTHDQSEALALSDRIGIMQGGRIIQIGAPTELYTNPMSPLARDFVGQSILLSGKVCSRHPTSKSVVVELDHTDNLSLAAPCSVAIRPECVLVELQTRLTDCTQSVRNTLYGEVVAVLFMGGCVEATLRMSSGKTISIVVPASLNLKERNVVCLTLPPSHLSLWPAEEA
jgi:ABC-type Fe3+/spermidine/putrescine transport system ATPase subunit